MKKRILLIITFFITGMICLSTTSVAEKTPKEVKSCDNGNLDACADLGLKYMRGKDVRRNEKLAEKILLEACDKGSSLACSRAGYFYNELASEPRKAIIYLEKACQGNIAVAFGNLGYMYHKGNYVSQDDVKAARLYEKSCELEKNTLTCHSLAEFYSIGKGLPEDDLKSIQILESLCEAGRIFSCHTLGYKYATGKDVTQNHRNALKSYQVACKGKISGACISIAKIYETGGTNVKVNIKQALRYYKKSCKLHSNKSCRKVAILSQKKRSY